MYALYGIGFLLRIYAVVAAAIAMGALAIGGTRGPPGVTWTTLHAVWSSVGAGTTGAGILLWALGQTALFPRVCRLGPLRRYLPDLDGRWQGTLHSNWPQVAPRQPGVPTPDQVQPVPVTVIIRARLLSVTMCLESEDRYSRSETVLAGVEKRTVSDVVRLSYLYENTTEHPERGDSSHHLGAARLELRTVAGAQVLEGRYWTNRNWENGLNTAGTLSMSKVA